MGKELLFYRGNGNPSLGINIITRLSDYANQKFDFNKIDFTDFPDGEPGFKIPNFSAIKDKTVIFYQSVFNQCLFEETLELAWAFKKQYQAAYLITVLPFITFRRQDHEEKSEEVCRLKMALDRLKHAGVDEIITLTPHSEKITSFCCDLGLKINVIDPSGLFADVIKKDFSLEKEIKVYAPDQGALPRAIALAKMISSPVIFSLKTRVRNNDIKINPGEEKNISEIISKYHNQGFLEIYHADEKNIKNSFVIMIEDEVSTGATANKVGCLIKSLGAKNLILLASHAVLSTGWEQKIADNNPFDKLILGDTVPQNYKTINNLLIEEISFGDLIAQSLSRRLKD